MDPQVIPLMVDVVEDKMEKDVMAYQPEEENNRFVISVKNTVMLIDERRNAFVPLKRGDSFTYLDLKDILEGLDLKYNSRTRYPGN